MQKSRSAFEVIYNPADSEFHSVKEQIYVTKIF